MLISDSQSSSGDDVHVFMSSFSETQTLISPEASHASVVKQNRVSAHSLTTETRRIIFK